MKKLRLLAFVGVATFALAFTSCKKDATCTCTYPDGQGDFTYPYEGLNGDQYDAAEAACEASNSAAELAKGSCKWE